MPTLTVTAAFPDPPFNGMPDNTGLAIAVPIADQGLLRHITVAQEGLEGSGMLQQMRLKWLGNGALEQSVAMR